MTVRIWARKGLGPYVAVLVVVFTAYSAVSSHPWVLEFDWAARYGAAYVYFVAPVVAAAVAYDVGRRARPDLALIGLTAPRGAMAVLAPAAATLLWAAVGAVVSWLILGVMTRLAGGLPVRDPWIFLETLSALAAAAALGTILGLVIEGVLAVAVSAGAVLMASTITSGKGANLFQVATSTGTMVGLERTPARALATVVCHLAMVVVALICVAVMQRAVALSPRTWVVPAAGMVVPVVAAMVWPYSASEYRPSSEATTCVGTPVQVCGPRSARPLLVMSASDLNAADRRLESSGLPLPRRFVIARGDAAASLGERQTLLDLDSSQLTGGHLPVSSVASALSTPRLCRGFYSAQEAPQLIDRVREVSTWVSSTLSTNNAPGPAPASVRDAYRVLTQCQVS